MSGATMKRPGFNKMCKDAQAGDTLVFTSLDRFARTETEAYTMILEWVRTDIKVRVLNIGTIEDTEVGRLILHIMLAFSEFERDIIIARTQNARSLKRAQDPLYKEGRPLKFSRSCNGIIKISYVQRNCGVNRCIKVNNMARGTKIEFL